MKTIFDLLTLIKDKKLKNGTKIKCSDFPVTYIYENETLGFYSKDEFIELTLKDILENLDYANYEIIEDIELHKTITYKDLEWYIIDIKDNEVKLLLKDVLDEERIKKYSTDEWFVNGKCVAHSDCVRAPFNWDLSYIKNTILDNFSKDINCPATLLTKEEVEDLPTEIRKSNEWYWTKSNASSENDRYAYAWYVDSDGFVDTYYVYYGNGYGVRPVITISKSEL